MAPNIPAKANPRTEATPTPNLPMARHEEGVPVAALPFPVIPPEAQN